jgi:uncharacterized protein
MSASLIVKPTPEKGDGVFSCRAFARFEIVIVGFIERDLEGNTAHASEVGPGKYVLHGGLMSKVNHSCDPNCGVRLNADGAHDLVAMRQIASSDEVTYDYAMRNSRLQHFPRVCKCGTRICRVSIKGWCELPQEVRVRYTGFIAPHLIEANNDGIC